MSYCPFPQECKKCEPDAKVSFKVNKINQTVILSDTDLITNKTTSRALENCSIVDDKNFICGQEERFKRSDGGITTIDSRKIVRNGILEDNPHIRYMDRNGNFSTPKTKGKVCYFKKSLFGKYELIN
jgi:hypothetical protein